MSPLARHWLLREHRWCRHANHWCERALTRHFFSAISRLGDGAAWYALMLGCVLLDGWAGLQASLHLAATGVFTLWLYRRLKRHTQRPRPCARDRGIRPWVAPLDEFSFPSGHTLHAVTFSAVAVAHYPWLAWLLLPFTALVAASRVVLGLHYPSDVLAASAIGSLIAAASIGLGALA
jgi:undecaprenyl-diphosphatase